MKERRRRQSAIGRMSLIAMGTPVLFIGMLTLGLIVLVSIFGLLFWGIHTFHSEPLQREFEAWADTLPVEAGMPQAYTVFSRVYLADDTSFYPETLLSEQLGVEILRTEVLCIRDGVLYAAFCEPKRSQEINEPWHLASLALDTMQAELLYMHEQPAKARIQVHSCDDYAERDAWYYDGVLCLNDGQNVVEWNMDSGTAETFAHDAYPFPTAHIWGEPDPEDRTRMTIRWNGGAAAVSLDDMAQGSEAITAILDKRDEVIWNGETHALDKAFTEYSVQHDGETLWVIVGCYAQNGETWAMFLRYDGMQERWLYAGRVHTSELLNWNVCRVIPVVE